MPDLASDAELVRLTRQGEPRAFEELMVRHWPGSIRTAMAVLHDEADVEDEVQNTWWKVYVHIDQFNEDALFTTWLARITVNQCLTRLRRKRRFPLLSLDAKLEGGRHTTFCPPDPRPHPESVLVRRQTQETLHSELRRIPRALRDTMTLFEIEGLSMKSTSACCTSNSNSAQG
jgi:RNA polymerase sigma-70 factor (ECF subfamily)